MDVMAGLGGGDIFSIALLPRSVLKQLPVDSRLVPRAGRCALPERGVLDAVHLRPAPPDLHHWWKGETQQMSYIIRSLVSTHSITHT